MSESYTFEVGGFTMVPDKLVKEFSFFTAGLYGKIWRYEQMSDEVCRASLSRLAADMSVSDDSIQRHLARLIEAGYIMDLTPNLRNRPHIYKTTGKLRLSLTISEAEGVKEPVPQNAVVVPQNAVVQSRKMRHESDSLKRQKRDNRSSPLAYEQSWGSLIDEMDEARENA